MKITDLEKITLTDGERNILAAGCCPKCKVPIKGKYQPVPEGWHGFAPEIYATLRENHIDLQSGHKESCGLRGLRLGC